MADTTCDETLREIQKRIAEARGWTDVVQTVTASDPPQPGQNLLGRHPDRVGVHLIPRWPQEWCGAGVLVAEMCGVGCVRYTLDRDRGGLWTAERVMERDGPALSYGSGATDCEAIARCWCAWQGIDLSDLR